APPTHNIYTLTLHDALPISQSFILDARSGYTEGTVGFGLDVLGLYSFKLDGNRGAANTNLMPIHDDGEAADQFGRTAVAAKAKRSEEHTSELQSRENLVCRL